ncbi:ATP-binding cassette glutathione S-conjugate transporter ycf1 [Podospora pseudoanserina]|uniref:ATP-binding cassette glutathione S-conjugate transporter ycf1 n=1 Tax=Podospora pseudoanserina TaxID=2609844 RepID=A0ABR0HKQ0_9PEZI|nr:ATP-binding cassette glutathione S-conjugate transporter ycf1 [Podospora pseudoanserina]
MNCSPTTPLPFAPPPSLPTLITLPYTPPLCTPAPPKCKDHGGGVGGGVITPTICRQGDKAEQQQLGVMSIPNFQNRQRSNAKFEPFHSPCQRQLVSLARAMLTPSNILVLDEATAAVDVQTDALLQNTLRGPLFANRTIITVAHRINTILDSDRVVVLERGEVVEFDTPERLIEKRGVFYGLVREAGLAEE